MDVLLPFLSPVSRLGSFGYVVAFLIALVETLPFIGILFPGTVFLFIFGFFASQGYLRLDVLVLVVASGAFFGDLAGYLMGMKGKRLFREGSRLYRISHLRKGTWYLDRHGAFAIFLGRFAESLRPIVPFAAGRLGMRPASYLFRSFPAAFLFAWAVLTAGFLSGGAVSAIGTWFSRVSVVFLFLFFLFGFLWFVAERSHPFLRVGKSVLHAVAAAVRDDPGVRRFLRRYPGIASFLRRRLDRKTFTGIPLSLSTVVVAYVIFLLLGTAEGILTAEPILSVDARVANLMYSFRDPGFIRGFLWVTLLGRKDIVIAVASSATLLLFLVGRRGLVFPLWLTIGGAQLCAMLGKRLLDRPRPEYAYYTEPSFSFPSGHAALSVALYGFLAYAVLRGREKRWRYRTLVLFIALVVAVAVGLSRLYLGVHFASDVWAGHLLGSLWLIIGISVTELASSRRSPSLKRTSSVTPFRLQVAMFSIILSLTAYYAYQGTRYEPIRSFADTKAREVVTDDILRAFGELGLPRFSETFSGAHQEPMNVIVVARDEAAFVSVMERAGWLRSDPVTVPNMAKLTEASFSKRSYPRAPMTPSFWNTHVHDLGFQKETDEGTVRARHHARFWKAPVRTVDGESVYVGTASLDTGIKWIVTHRIDPDIDTERETLFADLVATGRVESSEKIQFVDPVLGKNFSGDPFFTDGEAYLLRLR